MDWPHFEAISSTMLSANHPCIGCYSSQYSHRYWNGTTQIYRYYRNTGLSSLCVLSLASNGHPFLLSPTSPLASWLFQSLSWLTASQCSGKLRWVIQIQIVCEKHNLPAVFDSCVSSKVKRPLASTIRSGLCHTRASISMHWISLVIRFPNLCLLYKVPLDPRIVFVGPALVYPTMRTSLPLRRSFSNDTRNWGLACIVYEKWCLSIITKNKNGNRTNILPAMTKPKFALAQRCIVPPCQLCLIARARERVPIKPWNTSVGWLWGSYHEGPVQRGDTSLRISLSVRRPDVCRPGMDVNHPIAIIKAEPSLMMPLQASIRLRTKILKVNMKRLWANFVSTSAFWPIRLESQTLSWLRHLLCREISERFQQEKTEQVFLRCQCSTPKRVGVGHAIQIIIHIAHTIMVHVSLHWTDRGSIDISLWSFAVKHSL